MSDADNVVMPEPHSTVDIWGHDVDLYTADQYRAAVLAERERCAKVCDMRYRSIETVRAHAEGSLQGANPKYFVPLLTTIAELAAAIRKGTP